MTEEQLKEYVVGGGHTYMIHDLQSYRDGGTGVARVSGRKEYYLHKEAETLHSDYPPTPENQVTGLALEFFADVLDDYIERQEEELTGNKARWDRFREQNGLGKPKV